MLFRSGKETRRRNAHFIPMEDDEDELGSTMQMPKPTSEEVNGVATYMPNQKLTRINPVRVEKKEPVKQPVEEPKEAVKPKFLKFLFLIVFHIFHSFNQLFSI